MKFDTFGLGILSCLYAFSIAFVCEIAGRKNGSKRDNKNRCTKSGAVFLVGGKAIKFYTVKAV